MNNINLRLIFLSILLTVAQLSNGQPVEHYPCENSLIGKLVTKPLLKDGQVKYELALHLNELDFDKLDSGVWITSYKIGFITFGGRFRKVKQDSLVQIIFQYNKVHDLCLYSIWSQQKDKESPTVIPIDEMGKVFYLESDNEKLRKDKQDRVDHLLKHFE